MTQASNARAALEAKMKAAEAPPEDTMTQRQRAMANLAKGGVKDAKGGGVKTGGKPGGQIEALKAAAGVTDEGPQKGMVPNWKQTGGQRKAHQEKMAARLAGNREPDGQRAQVLWWADPTRRVDQQGSGSSGKATVKLCP